MLQDPVNLVDPTGEYWQVAVAVVTVAIVGYSYYNFFKNWLNANKKLLKIRVNVVKKIAGVQFYKMIQMQQ